MEIDIADRQDTLDVPPQCLADVIGAAFRGEGCDGELSVVLVGDEEMTDLNARFHGRRRTTDVLAFDYEREGDLVRGEIIVNAELAAREAAGRAHRPLDELLLYVAHGALHLLGYDDHEADDRTLMRRREQEVLHAAGRSAEY